MSSVRGSVGPQRGAATAAVLSLLCAGAAHADTLLVSDSHQVQGAVSPSTVSYSFNVAGPGTLSVSLADVVWPSALTDLSFTLTSAAAPLGELAGAGTKTFDISGAGTYYAYVTGEATNPQNGLHLNLGLYSLNIDFNPSASPVPLPSSLGVLAAALGCLGFMLRRRYARNV